MIQDHQMNGYNTSFVVVPNQTSNGNIPIYSSTLFPTNPTINYVSNGMLPQYVITQQPLNTYEVSPQPVLIKNYNKMPNKYLGKMPIQSTSQKRKDKTKNNKNQRNKFSPEEDEKLKNLVESMGSRKWEEIAKEIPGRTGRQCRDRYKNYLVPGFFNGQWSQEEDQLLFQKYLELGSQWSKIALFFPNRSSNSLKNRWNYFISKHMNFPFSPLPFNTITKSTEKIEKIENDRNNDDTDNNYNYENDNDNNNNDNDENDCSEMINYNVHFNYYIDSAFDIYDNPIITNDHLGMKDTFDFGDFI